MAQLVKHHTAEHGEQKQDREQRKRPSALRSPGEEDISRKQQEAPVNVNADAEGSTQFPGSEHCGVIFLVGEFSTPGPPATGVANLPPKPRHPGAWLSGMAGKRCPSGAGPFSRSQRPYNILEAATSS